MTTLHTEVLKPPPISPDRIMELAAEAVGVDAGQLEPYREAHILFATKLLAELPPQPDAAANAFVGIIFGNDTSGMGCHASINRMLPVGTKLYALSTTLVEPAIPTPSDATLTEAQDAPSAINGWKMVPIEPTREMIDAYLEQNGRFHSARSDWSAMIAAAPRPEQIKDE